MMASGDIPVVWPNNCGSTTWPMIPSTITKSSAGLGYDGPAGIDRRSEGQWDSRGNKCSRVGYEPQHSADNAPEDRIGNADKAQSQSDDNAEGRVNSRQSQEVPTKATCTVIKSLRGAMQMIRADETND